MNTPLKGEECVLEMSFFTLKRWRLKPRLRTDKYVTLLVSPN